MKTTSNTLSRAVSQYLCYYFPETTVPSEAAEKRMLPNNYARAHRKELIDMALDTLARRQEKIANILNSSNTFS